MKTKRIPGIMVVSLFLIGLLGACGSRNASDVTPVSDVQDKTVSETGQAAEADKNTGSGTAHPIPQELKNIPEEYYQAADQQGTLTDLYYDTYESFSYNEKSKPLQKHAVVYLPYGYSKDQKYDVFYLMHGGGGDETMTLGTPIRPSSFKNTIDHAVAAGEMRPLIIVCPTYNNTNKNGRDSANFSLAMQLTENYHNELINDLIPAVEGTYSTYAASTSKDDLIASRDHRGFGGFSMGSVATWRTFQYGLDYFHYFLPMSCGTSLNDEEIFAAAEGHDPDDYFVFVMTGTDDFAYSYDKGRTDLMRASKYFRMLMCYNWQFACVKGLFTVEQQQWNTPIMALCGFK
jgi:enterochelin esterase-like enzyme